MALGRGGARVSRAPLDPPMAYLIKFLNLTIEMKPMVFTGSSRVEERLLQSSERHLPKTTKTLNIDSSEQENCHSQVFHDKMLLTSMEM